jgi:predicted nucleic acid-binding protein
MEVEAGKHFLDKLYKIKEVCLDTSIFIYHLEDISPYNILTKILVKKIAAGEIFCYVSALTVTELLTKPYKIKDIKKISLFEDFIQSLPNTKIQDIDYNIAKRAAKIRANNNLRTPDAILLATASINKSSCFITNDVSLKNISVEDISILVLNDYL